MGSVASACSSLRSSAIGLRAPAAGEAAPTPSHVAVVIAGQGSYCTAWHSGMTGADALQAVARVTWGTGPYAGGFVIGINGVVTNPTQKYWSYWHGNGGGWSYSAAGATGYQVPAGGLEGWSISVTNGALTSPPPASYAGVCAGADAPPAPPPRPPATTAPAHPAASTPRPAPAPVGAATSAGGGAFDTRSRPGNHERRQQSRRRTSRRPADSGVGSGGGAWIVPTSGFAYAERDVSCGVVPGVCWSDRQRIGLGHVRADRRGRIAGVSGDVTGCRFAIAA